jgi:hypothetical protein
MLQRFALMLGLLFSAIAPWPRQASVQADAKLIHRYEKSCGYSCAQELAIDLGGVYGKNPDDTVAVRLCSKEPLPVALSISAAAYGYVISILEGSYRYTPERLLFLRSKDCLGADELIAATEFWVIPKGATLPSSVESMKSSQVRIDSLGMEGLIGNVRTYKVALQKLLAKLRGNPEAVGVVVGYYYKQPSPVMKRRLGEARRMLERSGLPKDRYSIRLSPWTGEQSVDSSEPEPKYPSVFVVELRRERARR